MHCIAVAVPGLYCVGWLKRGPSGIIGTNISDARETMECIVEDIRTGAVVSKDCWPSGGRSVDALHQLLAGRGQHSGAFVDWAGYKAIDAAERRKGEAIGKPREKLVAVSDMLTAAAAGKGTTTP